jgi:periplasmic protein TonB
MIENAGVLRWSGSFALALALHVLAIDMLFANGRGDESPAPSPPAIMLELAALPVTLADEPEIVPPEATAVTSEASPQPPAPEASAAGSTEPPPTCDPQATRPDDTTVTLAEWKGLLLHHLERHKQYPADAQRRGQQGTPHVLFTMCRDGRVLAARILRTSGVESLDRAGVDLVRRAEPLPSFPQGQSGDTLDLVVPVEFFLVGQGQ